MDRESVFRAAFWSLLVGVFAMRALSALRARRAGERVLPDSRAIEREGPPVFLARVAAFLLLLAWLVLYAIHPSWMVHLAIPLPDWMRWVGFGLGVVSLWFWAWTQEALGQEWSPQLQLRDQHSLVTTGPYARVRHPLYTAMLGFGVSSALVTANWVFVAIAVLVIAGLLARVPREEQMMIGEFGDDYRGYMARTGRFLPR